MLDKNEHYGTVLGDHPTSGYLVQDGRVYKPNGVEVDPSTGVPLPMAEARAAAESKKAAKKSAASDGSELFKNMQG